MEKRNLTCIVCPLGCPLTVTLEGKEVVAVEGNTCPRGKAYAEAECTAPVRTVTTTVRCESGRVISVKTSAPVPKKAVFDVMAEINGAIANSDVKIGDVIIANVCDTGVDVVATANAR